MDVKVLKPGDRIDLRILSQVEESKKRDSQKEILVFKSQVYDVNEDGRIQIAIPMLGKEMIRFPIGTMLEALFYSSSSLYKGNLEVTGMVKEGSLPVLEGIMIKGLSKHQRRQYYRLDKMLNLSYSLVEQPDKDLVSQEGYLTYQYQETIEPAEAFSASSLNISGGGMKLLMPQKLEKKQRVMLDFSLESEEGTEAFHLLGEVIESTQIEGMQSKFVTRVQFLSLSESQQERIIRYIFNEERRQLRKKG